MEKIKSKISKIASKKNLTEIVKHPLFSGSAIMIVGTNFGNFIAYIYHLIFGRLLGPANYGNLAATISVIGFISSFFTFIILVVTKFVSASDEKDLQKLFSWFTKRGLLFGSLFGIIVFLLTHFLTGFLHISYGTLVWVGPILFIGLMSLIFKSFLQGSLKFKEYVITLNLEILGRVIFGLIFVGLGFSVGGAIFGYMLSILFGLIVGRWFLRKFKIFGIKDNFSEGSKVIAYTIPIFLTSLATSSFFSTDLILVKHFFTSYDAGIYASVSTLGKVIFYAAAPVAGVMFPMVSKRYSKGENGDKIFWLSFALTAAICFGVLVLYFVLPKLAVVSLYGQKFLAASTNLFQYAIFMSIFTLDSLIINFFLSKLKTKVTFFVLVSAILQGLGIWFYHGNITNVIEVSIFASSLLLVSLLIYFAYQERRTNEK